MKKFLLSAAMVFIACWTWSQNVNVTFQVDMTNVTGYTTPEVNGTFNSWCGNCNAMTYSGSNNIWAVTVSIPANTTYEYKFSHDFWTGQENLVQGTACTVTNGGFTNRQVIVGSSDMVLPVVCWGSCSTCAAPPRAVTFQVDLSNVSGFTTPTVNGSFNSWSGTANPLSDANSDGIWETTIYIPDGTYEYKFAYDDWAGQETLIPGSACTVTNFGYTNRSLTVSADATLPVVCWNSCSNCAAALLPKNVTFKVDMQNVTGFTTAYVNGSFNGWCGSCNPMTDANSDGIWETTIQLNQDTFEYKFTFDGWTGSENLTPGSPCTSTLGGYTNRSIIVGNADQVLPVVCWESCTTCAPPTRNVTFKVDMSTVSGFNPAVNVPCVNGSWDGWLGGTHPMTDANSDGIWEATIALVDGSYEYKFAYDGWNQSENLVSGSSCTVTTGGYTNRSLTVNGSAQVLSAVCWESCNACAAPTYNVTFQVNMANESGFGTPYISGSFNGWCGNCNAMSDANNDDIYEVTIALQNGNYEYKVTLDDWTSSEQLASGSSCTVTNFGYTNRSLVVNGTPQTLPVVCYASCSDCVQEVSVTFQVNMEQVTGYGTPEVNGSFNGWCGGCFQLNDFDGDDVWTGTATLTPGTYEFKYAYDSWAGQENLIPGLPCTVTNFGYTNRQLVITGDTILPITCWASCGECINNYDVTFNVDMSNVVGFGTPEVNGDFNAWCGGCFQLTDPDGNGIYTGTATIQEGIHDFKFAYDSWSGQESLTDGSPCTSTNFGFTNRRINVTGDVVLPVVCWNACSSCGYAVSNDSPFSAPNVQYSSNAAYPNCYPISGSTLSASDSPQSDSFSGKDVWYKFTAQSQGVSITVTSPSQDDYIALYSRSGGTYTLMSGGTENAASGAGDFERLNYFGLTPGQQYYVSVGSTDNTGSNFSLCIQHLMPSGCAYTEPAGGFSLCGAYKAIYRGSTASGVSYGFNFTGVGGGASGTTSLSGTNGLITLSNPTLALRYGGEYNVTVDANYALLNGAGTAENITIAGSTSSPNCSGVSIRPQPLMEVKSTQRCNASLLRSNWLIGSAIAGDSNPCGAINYTYEFTQVASCSDGTTVSVSPSEFTTGGSTPYLGLGVLPAVGANNGAWNVRIRPNFTYGNGVYGPTQRIQVARTAASGLLEDDAFAGSERTASAKDAALYPNPNEGTWLNLNMTDVQSDKVVVSILDATGRMVYSEQFSVDGTLNAVVQFQRALTAGMYMVEFADGSEVSTQRLVVE
jgi:1,4-alpha-glucan branching enzyme